MSYLVPLIAIVFVVVVGCYLASVPQEEDHQYIVAILGLIVPLIIVAVGVEVFWKNCEGSCNSVITELLSLGVCMEECQSPLPVALSLAVTSCGWSDCPPDAGLRLEGKCSRPVAGVKVSPSSGNWVAWEVGESILLGMECPVAASCSGELSALTLTWKATTSLSAVPWAKVDLGCLAEAAAELSPISNLWGERESQALPRWQASLRNGISAGG
ncbi:hypothetical protein Tco_0116226 [Tanacetum coccineum]